MAAYRYRLDGASIEASRRQRGWTQKDLARRAGIALRIVNDVEKNKRPVATATAEWLAQALGVPLASLTVEAMGRRDVHWRELPASVERWRARLLDAAEWSMRGSPTKAIGVVRAILREMPEPEHEARAVVIVKLANYLDDAGMHEDALEALNALANSRHVATRVSEETRLWARYHEAIARRRMGQFAQAERLLRTLMREPSTRQAVAARHQLGALYLERGLRRRRRRMVHRAVEELEASRAAYRSEGNHREGFSLRRMAQAYRSLGRRNDSVMCLFEAAVVFAKTQCHRYLEETREELNELLARPAMTMDGPAPE